MNNYSQSQLQSQSQPQSQSIETPTMIRLDSIDSFKIINPNIDETSDTIDNNNNNDILPDLTIININTDPELIYTQLLDEIYEIISDNNQMFGSSNANVSKPDIKYENRKTFWYNYGKNCSQLNRSTFQLKLFFEKELAVESSINDKSNLILRGKYNFNLIASTFKKYIKNYVQCSTCKSIQTEIIRNSSNRLDYLKCLNPKCNTCKVVVKL
jgi:translation initiation factor 2 subunit 2